MSRLRLLVLLALVAPAGCGRRDEGAGGGPERPAGTPLTAPEARDDGRKHAARPPGETAPVGVGVWSQVGEVRVRVTRATVRAVPLMTDKGTVLGTKGEELLLRVEIENRSREKPVPYDRFGIGWAGRPGASARDEHGTRYAFRHPAAEGPGAGGSPVASLPPGGPALEDVLCVEMPGAAATVLTVRLPSAAGGAGHPHVFAIPASAWGR